MLAGLGCGTVLYPDRRGQDASRIDPAVVILDGIGLLFFFLPGVVAFAVDFATGAIYLPGGDRASLTDPPLQRFEVGVLSAAEIERVVSEQTGVPVSLGSTDLRVIRARPGDDLAEVLRSWKG
jgi:hypothetical protein